MPEPSRLDRRSFLGAAVTTAASIATGAAGAEEAQANRPDGLRVLDLTVPGDKRLSQRFVLCVPTHLAEGARVPLVVALHGAAETVDARTGAFAFVERYGLMSAYDRLRHAPVARTLNTSDYFGEPQLMELNTSLARVPFAGLAIACPYMPWISRMEHEPQAMDDYAAWLVDVVLPRARKEAPVFADVQHTSIDGVSLGGYTGLEVFLRRPEAFGAWGCVQGALGSAKVAGYAERLAGVFQSSPKDFHLETSSADPFHDATVRLSERLIAKGIPNDPLVYPGPHDQVWLRESGTIGMLRWHDARGR